MNIAQPYPDDCPPRTSSQDIGPCGTFEPGPEADILISYLAWAVSAAAVAGVIFVGIQMALQVRRGEIGEGATYFRSLVIVLCACLMASTAGPLVDFVITPYL